MTWVELQIWDGSSDFNTRDKHRILAEDMEEVFSIADAYIDECKAADPHIEFNAHIYDAREPYALLYTRYGDDDMWEEWVE